jgi:hypothetical protein
MLDLPSRVQGLCVSKSLACTSLGDVHAHQLLLSVIFTERRVRSTESVAVLLRCCEGRCASALHG